MHQVEVQHYLNPAGMDFFPEWFARVESFISKQTGFQSMKYFTDPADKGCMRITLFFDNKANMMSWVAVPAHDAALKELDQYRTKPWEAQHIDHDAKEVYGHVIYLDGRLIEKKLSYIAPKI